MSGRVADFLADAAGIEFKLGEFAFGHGAQRSHSWKAEKNITDFLFEAVERERNIQVCFTTPVLSLSQEASGAVTGVVTDEKILTGRKVILASGGFGASQELLSRVYTQSCDIPFQATLAALGMESKWVWRREQRRRTWVPSNHTPPTLVRESARYLPRLLYWRHHGRPRKRFVDETKYPGGLGTKMLDLPGKQAYEIFDERIYQLHSNISGLRNLASLFDSGILKKAQTAEELAGRLGIDAGGLKQTIQDYNRRRAAAKTLLGAHCRYLSVPHFTESRSQSRCTILKVG